MNQIIMHNPQNFHMVNFGKLDVNVNYKDCKF